MIHSQIRTEQGDCRVMINGSFSELQQLLKKRPTVLITDSTVRRLYKDFFPSLDVIEIDPGEGSKSLATIHHLYHSFLALGVDRSTLLLGLGGGVICDLTGFAASTYMRGIPFAFVPTSLLAQVDAALGGKNGVNFNTYKNLVGVFSQPEFVFIDFTYLHSLPKSELLNGLAEIIKHALIAGMSLFQDLEQNWPGLLALDEAILERIVAESIAVKAGVVESDLFEKGPRRVLNLGHTLGHAIEREGVFKHGEAVSLGMAMTARLSVLLGIMSADEASRIQALLEQVGLPTQAPLSALRLMEAVKKDKKQEQKDIHFVLLSAIGSPEITKIPIVELEEYIHDLCKPG